MCLGISFWAKTDVQDAAVADRSRVLNAGLAVSGRDSKIRGGWSCQCSRLGPALRLDPLVARLSQLARQD